MMQQGNLFDKVARLLGISNYLGGAKLSKVASGCTNNTALGLLPRPKLKDNDLDFSFSGLKTAVYRLVEKNEHAVDSIACEFENAVVDVLVAKTIRSVGEHGVKSVLLGGGVAANVQLRTRLKTAVEDMGLQLFVPPLDLCTDNAVYIATAAFYNYKPQQLDKIIADPSLTIVSAV